MEWRGKERREGKRRDDAGRREKRRGEVYEENMRMWREGIERG